MSVSESELKVDGGSGKIDSKKMRADTGLGDGRPPPPGWSLELVSG